MRKNICFFGPDGAGKTTLAKGLAYILSLGGYKVNIAWLRGTHTLASVMARFLSKFEIFQGHDNPYYSIKIPETIKPLWFLIEFISILPVYIQRFIIPLFLGRLVIGERSLIDFIVWIVLTNKKTKILLNPLTFFLLKIASSTCFNIYIYADPKILKNRRKDKLSPAPPEQQLKLYNLLTILINAKSIDTSHKSIAESLQEILKLVKNYEGL